MGEITSSKRIDQTFPNACPPEDVGGPPGFMDFVEAMSDPKHEDHADMMRWHGKPFDPKRFDRGVVNRRLWKLKL